MKDFEDVVSSLFEHLASVDTIELRQIFQDHGKKKGVRIIDDLESTLTELYSHFNTITPLIDRLATLQSKGNENEIIKMVIAYAKIANAQISFQIHAMTFMNFIRSDELFSVLENIDIQKSSEELNTIDSQLTKFMSFNNLHALIDADKYPEYLIREGYERLNRVSQNYGKQIPFEGLDFSTVETEEIIDFPVDIFLEQENYQLFMYLLAHYAKVKRPVDLSHIYRWMEENNLIAKRTGMKYMKFTVDNQFVVGKFTRMADPDSRTRTPLNELRRAFNQTRVKTSK